jgi:hypothetical protein
MILQDQTNIAHLKTPTKKEIESDFQPRRNPECQRDLALRTTTSSNKTAPLNFISKSIEPEADARERYLSG